jgi:ABC-type sugar transport system substrate-binding protein
MKVRRAKRIYPLLILPISLFLAGCGGDSQIPTEESSGGKVLKVGFAQAGAESAWRRAETGSVKAEALKRSHKLKFADAQGKQEAQIAAVRDFIAQGMDAIILAPIVETGWDDVLGEAKDAGIPVVLVDRGVKVKDENLYATLIASDFVYEGKLAGEWLAKNAGGKARIIELEGTPGSAPAIDRKKGFDAVVDQHEGMSIIASQSGEFNIEKGKEVMEALLAKHADAVTAVYAHNDDMALGAIQALEAAGKTPGKDVIVLSIDGGKAALSKLVDGQLNCVVECLPLLGPAAFDAVEKILAGQTLEKWQRVDDQLFDATNTDAAFVEARPF